MELSPLHLHGSQSRPSPAELAGELPSAVVQDGTVVVYQDMEIVEARWRSLEETGICTAFQSYDWLHAWFTTLGAEEKTTPQIVTVTNAAGHIVCILPLGISEKGPIRVLHWLGGRHSNYNMGLYASAWIESQTPDSITALMRDILKQLPECDAIHLSDQPTTWNGHGNPFYAFSNQPSVNESYVMGLQPDYNDLYNSKRSSATRRSARKRDKRLETDGAVHMHAVETSAELDVFVEQLLAQKRVQMEALGVGDLFGRRFPDFIRSIGPARTRSGLQLKCTQLMCGDDIVATVFGTTFKRHYYGLVLAMAAGPHARHSPGDLALRMTIEDCCRSGLTSFDFSQGEAAYKSTWADRKIDLFDSIVGVTALGHIYAGGMRCFLALKRKIKKTPALFSLATSVRKALNRST